MPNMPHLWRDRDLRRLIRVAQGAGLDPVALEVDLQTRRIKITVGKSEPPEQQADLERLALGR
jgi:hypothetical protein